MSFQTWFHSGLAALLFATAPVSARAEDVRTEETKPTVTKCIPESPCSKKLKKKVPYSAVGVFGADTTFGAPDGWIVPIARAIGYKEYGSLDVLVQADTQGAFAQLEFRNTLSIGIRPHIDYVVHGDYRHFDEEGHRLRTLENTATIAGIDFMFSYAFNPLLTGKFTSGLGRKRYLRVINGICALRMFRKNAGKDCN
ncbi:MAG: hypothetical protein AABX37_02180 [Nanoarchaeota archaeon]